MDFELRTSLPRDMRVFSHARRASFEDSFGGAGKIERRHFGPSTYSMWCFNLHSEGRKIKHEKYLSNLLSVVVVARLILTKICTQCVQMRPTISVPMAPNNKPEFLNANGMARMPVPNEHFNMCANDPIGLWMQF